MAKIFGINTFVSCYPPQPRTLREAIIITVNSYIGEIADRQHVYVIGQKIISMCKDSGIETEVQIGFKDGVVKIIFQPLNEYSKNLLADQGMDDLFIQSNYK
jgi:hypothetical protein